MQSADVNVNDKDCFSNIKHEILLHRKKSKYINSSFLNFPGILNTKALNIKKMDNKTGKSANW